MLSKPVTIYQMDVLFGNAEENLTKINGIAKDIKEENTLLVVPELCLTGYSKSEIERSAFGDGNEEYIRKLSDICADYSLQIYGSIAEKDGGKYYNTAVFVDSSGLIAKYRKSHLFGPMGEKDLFSLGQNVVSLTYQEISFGLSICYDLRFPSMYQTLASKGAEVMLISAEWPITRVNHWSALLRARAIENQAFVIGVNRVGTDGSYIYGGYSAIFSPYGDPLIEISNSKEGSQFTMIDLSLVEEFRQKFDVREDRSKEMDLTQ